jgi:uncharacterized protein (DUF2141 family)
VELRNRLAEHNISLTLPSQRVDRFDAHIAHILGGTRQAGLTFAPEAGSQSFTFDWPEGAYSISIWHDFNANGQFDMSEAGPPADGWAMINGEAMRAAPTFADASLTLPAAGTATTLKVIYPE